MCETVLKAGQKSTQKAR